MISKQYRTYLGQLRRSDIFITVVEDRRYKIALTNFWRNFHL